jgi:hypothetical protein
MTKQAMIAQLETLLAVVQKMPDGVQMCSVTADEGGPNIHVYRMDDWISMDQQTTVSTPYFIDEKHKNDFYRDTFEGVSTVLCMGAK